MSHIPSTLDRDLALRLCNTATLSDVDTPVCFMVALAADCGEPVEPDTLSSFTALLRKTAAA